MSAFRLHCPNCGERAANEFSFGGESIAYPRDGVETVEENCARVWLRENVQGRQSERWFHFGGCRRWITVARHTVTNEAVSDAQADRG